MSVRSKLFASAAALTVLGGGVSALTAGTANAATPACGASCINIFSKMIDPGWPAKYLLDVYKRGQSAGQPIILYRASDADPAEDFTIANEGPVGAFFKAGLVSAAFSLHYSGTDAVEIEYSPFGTSSGMCVAVAATATAGEPVTLQPCGVSSKSVWAVDFVDVPWRSQFAPLINGSDTNFSQPFVLTYPGNSWPTDNPRPRLYVTNLTGFAASSDGSGAGTITDKQLWSNSWGPLP